MDPIALLQKYDRRLPRYTSYPTAPHFGLGVDAATYFEWLAALPDGAPLSLYLHVPFCAQLCWYCGCHTTAVNSRAPLDAYAATLIMEIGLVTRAIGRRLPVTHVHWGGGTPHALPPDRMEQVMAALRAAFAFGSDTEIAVEVDPRTANDETLEGFVRMGVTRVSLGVQDFDPRVQKAVNRVQTAAETAACADGLRRRGVSAINIDLMYGLPYQTSAGVAETVQTALAMAPDRLAVFGYAHVPWMKKHQMLLPKDALPGLESRWAQRSAAEEAIIGGGYRAIGLDHYARPDDTLAHAEADGTLRRNFQGYTTDLAPILLGFGASAIGALPQGYAQNEPSVPTWREKVRAGGLPTSRGIAISDDDRLRRDVIEQVMCRGRADLRRTAARYGADPEPLLRATPALNELARDGVIRWDGARLEITAGARTLARNVAAVFDAYLQPGEGRHSGSI